MPKSSLAPSASHPPFHELMGQLAIGDAPTHLGWLKANYDNRAQVPTALTQLADWAKQSERMRQDYTASQSCALDLSYGPHAGERLDVFWPQALTSADAVQAAGAASAAQTAHAGDAAAATQATKGSKKNKAAAKGRRVVVFIHGGYWRGLDKADHSFLVPSLQRSFSDKAHKGAVVVMPNYALCPSVEIDDIALQLTRAMAWVYEHIHRYGGDATEVSVVGHSAGGHLATMLLACNWQAVHTPAGVALPKHFVRRALSVSGLYDLAPLQHAPFIQQDLRLTDKTIARCSPAYWPAPNKRRLYTVVGGDETSEFVRHNNMMRTAWGRSVVPMADVVAGLNHFSIVEALASGHPKLMKALRKLKA
jgi:arylformamidase